MNVSAILALLSVFILYITEADCYYWGWRRRRFDIESLVKSRVRILERIASRECDGDKEDKIETAIDSVGDDLETLASDIEETCIHDDDDDKKRKKRSLRRRWWGFGRRYGIGFSISRRVESFVDRFIHRLERIIDDVCKRSDEDTFKARLKPIEEALETIADDIGDCD